MTDTTWKKVIFAVECDDDGNCPNCGIDYSECDCPGPTMDGYDYRWVNGVLYARAIPDNVYVPPQTRNGKCQD